MIWVNIALVAVLCNAASSQSIGCSYNCPNQKIAPTIATKIAPTVVPTVVPTIAPTVVDGNVVQSLIDTIQLFIVSDLIAETLPEKKVIVPTVEPCCAGYDDCDILQYEFVYDKECPDFVAGMVPKYQKCVCECGCDEDCNATCAPMKCDCEYVAVIPRKCVNFGLNQELILPPYAPELPCGLGYLPGGLPVVAKSFAPCSKFCGFGPRGSCSAAALPICSPYSCAALAVPLCPDMSHLVKPIIL